MDSLSFRFPSLVARVSFALTAVVFVATLGACGGGGSNGGGGGPVVTFQVTQVTPNDLSQDIALTTEINVVFSDEIDPATLTPDTFQVIAESGDRVFGSRSIPFLNRSIARFLPQPGYFPFAVHTIRVTRGVLDLNGRPLDRDYEFKFQTEEEGPVLPGADDITQLPGGLLLGRWLHRMTLLPNGRFIVTGGYRTSNGVTDQAENLVVFSRQSFVIQNRMRRARAAHVQITLANGRILIAGGEVSNDPFLPISGCEIFDPTTFTFNSAASMNERRSFAHATLLPGGRVLVTGGQDLDAGGNLIFRDDAEIYDPNTDTWTPVANTMEQGRATHFSVTLAGGDAVIVGGTSSAPSGARFTLATESFADNFTPPSFVHFLAAGTVLDDGRLLVAGGVGSLGVSVYDPGFGFVGSINTMRNQRAFATATAFEDGRVLIVGGTDFSKSPALLQTTMDVWFPIGQSGKLFRVPDTTLTNPTSHHAAKRGPNGAIWITGGLPLDASIGHRQVIIVEPGDDE